MHFFKCTRKLKKKKNPDNFEKNVEKFQELFRKISKNI